MESVAYGRVGVGCSSLLTLKRANRWSFKAVPSFCFRPSLHFFP